MTRLWPIPNPHTIRPAAGVDIEAGYAGVQAHEEARGAHVSFPGRRLRPRRLRRPVPAGPLRHGGAGCSSSGRTASAPKQRIAQLLTSTTPSASTASPCASTTSSSCGAKPLFFLDIHRHRKNIPKRWRPSSPAWPRAVVQAAAPHRRRDRRAPRHDGSRRLRPRRLFPSASSTARRSSTRRPCAPATRCSPCRAPRHPLQRLLPRPARSSTWSAATSARPSPNRQAAR